MVAVIWIVLFLLAVVLFLWFRRTALYRAHRRIGVVQGQSGVGGMPGQSAVGNTPRWYGEKHVPPLLPELRPDVDQAPPSERRWRISRDKRPSPIAVKRRGRRSLKVLLSERSMRRSTAQELAVRRRNVAQDHDRIRALSVGRRVRRFFSPSEYPRGRVAERLACVYFAVTVLLIVSAIPEGNGDAFTVGLAIAATLPVSVVSLAIQGDGAELLAVLAVCALVNALVFWVVFRGDPE
jgi:hypothetical protein